MDLALKEFIEEHIDLIEWNDYDKLYEEANNEIVPKALGLKSTEHIQELTSLLLSIDIHPTLYFRNIPEDYAIGLEEIQDVVITNKAESIGSFAFANCKNLENIEFGTSLKQISIGAFQNCSALDNIILPDTIQIIEQGAFRRCASLSQINIPDKLSYISQECFERCENLISVKFNSSVTSINNNAFHTCTNLRSITLPNSLLEIHTGAFMKCINLQKIFLPKSLIKIYDIAFKGCLNTEFTYDGTKDELKAICDQTSIEKSAIIRCKDGQMTGKELWLMITGLSADPDDIFKDIENKLKPQGYKNKYDLYLYKSIKPGLAIKISVSNITLDIEVALILNSRKRLYSISGKIDDLDDMIEKVNEKVIK